MIRIGTIRQKEVNDMYIKDVTCPKCNANVSASLFRSVQTGTILFVPFIKKTVQYYTSCPCCNMKYILTKHNYNQIYNSSDVKYDWNRMCGNILEKAIKESDEGIIRSSKNVFVASVLSLVFAMFGLQNLYMGHKKRFLINILFFVLSVVLLSICLITKITLFVLPVASMMAVNVYWGIIDLIRILSGHAKDSKGRYLLTNAQYKKRLAVNRELHKTDM